MSFKKEKREQIKNYILEKIDQQQTQIASRTADAFQISLNSVYRYLRELEADDVIRKEGNQWHLAAEWKTFCLRRSKNELLSEDLIFQNYISPFLKDTPDNVLQIWQYSFMEMMNNAIEHSGAETVELLVSKTRLSVTILILDNGIGIFKKIRDYYRYDSLDDAVNELFKGKLTTDQKNHSGEGIFFTSRMLDRFAAISDGRIFTHDKYPEAIQNLEGLRIFDNWRQFSGTAIYMELSNSSKKKIQEIFDMFADVDGGFTKTEIPMKNIYDTFPVSRSQAKRLCHRFDSFEEVTLDFDGITDIGQGFAHEIFVVYQNQHPGLRLIPIHMSENVTKMVYHVLHSSFC